ncbi:Bile acid:sodium symporter OS=Tsukamurella paurometabola (strain ATCC 8368 / DSM / CCUG 35730/ CIP 100753 / JCM 10117 / KCTC 9821 / NBRC 16120 / NCIMB 702349 / NCTC 13040) OX=521096 GN=Tpau_2588 PE=4 SV=1 [Tsukamurella paurometabola]|uniref:Bile acid:sodium symporter n=1 Tax=Tsukamurella paurometabola (strain ATCC 8368 / DSM 20162 / CCUG 35730 / CIP 100753 / JCM 10117 / KCTC 9821 / NBRC 16120 / NCIMB 702349 / NCTC 13040) TaxID=521096 RepID=D5URY6_TSUPD|nr:bile acid:sodium symporter family protein [Tsukamurella paurometabola]ADG79191.1 Bile acid:sodium symporter [Tsukamurella paurometabola DSM 20162]SUP34476.1 bile acid transporter [Tsukamurella paurometabola]
MAADPTAADPPAHIATRIGRRAGTWFPLVVLAAGAVAVTVPGPFLSLAPAINPLLMVIMLGMGMTLRGADFAVVARRPVPLLIGVLAQFVIMPLTAWCLVSVISLDPAIAVGVILVAAAPGGTASNVMAYLAKGDVALSVAMTSVSTLVAPVATPLLVQWLAGSYLPVDTLGMFRSIVQIVIIPIAVGVLLRRFLPRLVDGLVPWMPTVSVAVITLVVLAVVAGSASAVLVSGLIVFGVVIALNGVGLLLGYGAARVSGLDEAARRAVSIEVGMQNSGLAAGLARTHFAPEAALPAAIFSVWHNISGSILASFWSRRPPLPR